MLSLSFMAGIISFRFPLTGVGFFFLILILVFWLIKKDSPLPMKPSRLIFREGIPLFVMAALGLGYAFFNQQLPANHLLTFEGKRVEILAEATQNGTKMARGGNCEIQALSLVQNEEVRLSGKALIYFRDTSFLPQRGDLIKIEGEIRALEAGENGYYQYLLNQGTRAIISSATLELVSAQGGGIFSRLQAFLVKELETGLPDAKISSLAKGMILGDRGDLSRGTRDSFRASGLSHLLAISGLHLGVIYLSLLALLGRIFPGHRQIWARHLLAILLIWVFALVSGAAPSACRAALMMSFLSAGKVFFLRHNSLTLLSFAALVLLAINPNDLYNPGFQLSFSAVFGILLFTKPISVFIHNGIPLIPIKITESVAVTLAAQLSTLPFILLNFGNFPTWFLLSNLIALPLAWLIIHLGFIYLSLCWIPFLGALLAKMLHGLLWALIWWADWIAGLPGAVIDKTNWHSTGLMLGMVFFTSAILLKFSADFRARSGEKSLAELFSLIWSGLRLKRTFSPGINPEENSYSRQ